MRSTARGPATTASLHQPSLPPMLQEAPGMLAAVPSQCACRTAMLASPLPSCGKERIVKVTASYSGHPFHFLAKNRPIFEPTGRIPASPCTLSIYRGI
jgi:hypothetical protein